MGDLADGVRPRDPSASDSLFRVAIRTAYSGVIRRFRPCLRAFARRAFADARIDPPGGRANPGRIPFVIGWTGEHWSRRGCGAAAGRARRSGARVAISA